MDGFSMSCLGSVLNRAERRLERVFCGREPNGRIDCNPCAKLRRARRDDRLRTTNRRGACGDAGGNRLAKLVAGIQSAASVAALTGTLLECLGLRPSMLGRVLPKAAVDVAAMVDTGAVAMRFERGIGDFRPTLTSFGQPVTSVTGDVGFSCAARGGVDFLALGTGGGSLEPSVAVAGNAIVDPFGQDQMAMRIPRLVVDRQRVGQLAARYGCQLVGKLARQHLPLCF